VLQAAQVILALGERTDVYVGAAPRTRAAGGKDAVRELWAVWADCDDEEARERLWDFRPAPSIVVATGSPHGCHAYWLLKRPLVPAAGEPANRRLAHALGADPRAVDAARILHDLSVDGRGGGRVPPARSVDDASLTDRCDPLLLVPPPVYFERLTGLRVGPSGKLHCLFHDDRSPSLHVYREPGRGGYCFGCGRGGSVYDLAALLFGRGTRGRDFVELRRELEQRLL